MAAEFKFQTTAKAAVKALYGRPSDRITTKLVLNNTNGKPASEVWDIGLHNNTLGNGSAIYQVVINETKDSRIQIHIQWVAGN